MKKKLMFLLAILFCLSYNVFSQTPHDVTVENNINTQYGITAVYVNGGSQITNTSFVGAGSSTTILYECPSDNTFLLSTFTFKATGCQSYIAATHTYSSSSTELVEDCSECDANGYSTYYISQNSRQATIECKD
ncbi:MAG: hypothetical protein U9R19_08800 [Bacteroidota bacterium]|nr:hypothetical protein [Bacteroidota bacterium]